MPITYNALRTVNGYRSPGFSVSTAGDIQTDATLTVSGTVTLNQSLTSSANLITSENFVGTNFELAEFFSESHEIFAYSMIFMVSIHILAIFKHYFIDKNKTNILKRII
jgi:cytochrome b561